MYYKVDYSICALLFLTIVMFRFYSTRQFPNKQNKLFGVALAFAALDIMLDVVSAYMHEYIGVLPNWSIYLINTVFYVFQTAFPAIMLLYVLIITGNFIRKNRVGIVLLMVPAGFVGALLATNCWTHSIFYIEGASYIHAPMFYCLYISTAFYAFACIAFINVYRRQIRRAQYWTVTAFIIIVLVAVVIQVHLPSYLLTGPAIALAITMMYLVIQKPEDMLDTMTGTFDRGALLVYLKDVISEKRRYDLINVRIDNMRYIDRLLGTTMGNRVLVEVAEYLMKGVGADWVFRIGSVRFVVICHSPGGHAALLNSIRRRFREPWDVSGYHVLLSASFCDIEDTSGIESVEQMMGLLETVTADIPRGEVLRVDDAVLSRVSRQEEVESAILEALDNDSFEVYFQPVYSVAKKSFITAEALLRLHYKGGFIAPDEFIPVAEQNGLIVNIDELVTRRVCEFFREYDPVNTMGLISAEINLSAMEFVYDGLPERISSIIDENGVPPHCLLFEITETAATTEYSLLMASMRTLTERGFRFVLDDFGTGFANLSQVVRLPFFAAKMDRSMLVAKEESDDSDVVYKSSLAMFKSLGLKTVAEGVETPEQAASLLELGVDYIQGFHYARPMPIDKFIEFMKKHNNIE